MLATDLVLEFCLTLTTIANCCCCCLRLQLEILRSVLTLVEAQGEPLWANQEMVHEIQVLTAQNIYLDIYN